MIRKADRKQKSICLFYYPQKGEIKYATERISQTAQGSVRHQDGRQRMVRSVLGRHPPLPDKIQRSISKQRRPKLYLYGKETERDYSKAVFYLSSAAEHGNRYAEQLLHSIKSGRNWSAALGTIRLLHHLSRMIQNRLEDERRGKGVAIERKLKRKIDEKKQAHGLRQGSSS